MGCKLVKNGLALRKSTRSRRSGNLKRPSLRMFLAVIFAITVYMPQNTVVECLECGYISRTFDFCLDYVLPIRKPK